MNSSAGKNWKFVRKAIVTPEAVAQNARPLLAKAGAAWSGDPSRKPD